MKRLNLYKVYFELTAFAGWKLVDAGGGWCIIERDQTSLFNMAKNKWGSHGVAKIRLYSNGKYEVLSDTAALSIYEMEVLTNWKQTKP